jgi:hypothetical protein
MNELADAFNRGASVTQSTDTGSSNPKGLGGESYLDFEQEVPNGVFLFHTLKIHTLL